MVTDARHNLEFSQHLGLPSAKIEQDAWMSSIDEMSIGGDPSTNPIKAWEMLDVVPGR